MSENHRNELALLDLKDAFKLAFQRSGKTQTTVAREMGWTMHNVQHVFGLNDHLPSARDIPKLCKVLGNEIILECMYGKARRRQPDAFEEIDCAALMIRLNGLFVSLGEAAKKGKRAIADGRLEAKELRGIIAELYVCVSDELEAIADLRATERMLAGKQCGAISARNRSSKLCSGNRRLPSKKRATTCGACVPSAESLNCSSASPCRGR